MYVGTNKLPVQIGDGMVSIEGESVTLPEECAIAISIATLESFTFWVVICALSSIATSFSAVSKLNALGIHR